MLPIDLTGKRVLIVGIADDKGLGFGIAKALAEAGATICVGTWPPAYKIFTTMLERGKFTDSLLLNDGTSLVFEKIYPFDAAYDTLDSIPQDIADSKRYRDLGDVSVDGLAARITQDFGDKPIDIVVHSLANSPDAQKSLFHTSRAGYLEAVSVSSYSFVSMVRRFASLLRSQGSFLGLTYVASQKVIPGYGGGMSSAKAALESDMRVLAYEVGRIYGHRVNLISAGAFPSRAASAFDFIQQMLGYSQANSPMRDNISAAEVGYTAAFLCAPLASGITGEIIHVDKGLHCMGIALDSASVQGLEDNTG